METSDKKNINLKKIRKLQEIFDKSMRILERQIAESITNKERLNALKRDLKEANEKFIEAERCLEDFKIDLENSKMKNN
tara:strand:+ start:333 stop:569 length:237 start_codon:yes stop_codon:yes gene_type:complete